MGKITEFPGCRAKVEGRAVIPGKAGELVALRSIDLDCVVETVRVLRSLDDPSLLDCFNRKDRPGRTSADG